jgi:hypothetical protein
VTEPCLGLEDLAAVDKERGDAVSEPVQGRGGEVCFVADGAEAVVEHADREPPLMGNVGGENPRSESAAGG